MLRFLLEAHEGLGLMHSEGDGWVTLMAPESQSQALESFIDDLAAAGIATRDDCPESP